MITTNLDELTSRRYKVECDKKKKKTIDVIKTGNGKQI